MKFAASVVYPFAIAVAVAGVAAPVPARAAPPPAGEYRVHAIDVGTGLSIFVEGADFNLLYDAGSRDDNGGGTNNRVLAYLRAVRPDVRRIDHLILSHPHEDHHEMMDSVLEAYEVGQVWDSGSRATSCGYRAFLEAVLAEPRVVYHNAAAGAAPYRISFSAVRSCHGRARPAATLNLPRGSRLSEGLVVPLGAGANMTFLHANPNARPNDLNHATVVARLDLGPRRVLLAGDAEAGGRRVPATPPRPDSIEGNLLSCCAGELRSDVLIVGHHGSMTSSRTAFLDAVAARDFVVSSGPYPYGANRVVLPDREVIDELERRGTLWRTDLNDAACRSNPAKIGVDRSGPGGCDHVQIRIDPTGAVTPAYFRGSD
jgi:beta-lactamase superfamily II metal-dependent hydrolase